MVVDDEALARRRLVRFLESEPDVEIVGVCADGPAAVEAIPRARRVGRDRCVILKDGAELPLSDRYRERLEAGTRPRN